MTVKFNTPISMFEIAYGAGGGLSQEYYYDLGRYYRQNSINYGWNPTSGPIDMDNMRGLYYRVELTGYSYSSSDYSMVFGNTYSGVYYYYYMSGLTDYRGLYFWYNNGSSYQYASPYWTACKMVMSSGRNYAGYYYGQGLPNGSIGEPGQERLHTISQTMYISGCWYYFGHFTTEALVCQRQYGYWGRYDFQNPWTNWYYNYMNTWYYSHGIRKDVNGTMYVGAYYVADIYIGGGPTFSSVRYESAITGSRLGGRNRQNLVSAAMATQIGGWYCGSTLYLYDYNTYFKGTQCSFDFGSSYGGSRWNTNYMWANVGSGGYLANGIYPF